MKKTILAILMTLLLYSPLVAQQVTSESLEDTILELYTTGLVHSHSNGKVYVDSLKWVCLHCDVREIVAYIFAADQAMSPTGGFVTEILIYNYKTGKEIDLYDIEG